MKLPIYLPESLHRRAKASALSAGETLQEFASAATLRELAHRAHRRERSQRRTARMERGRA